MKELEKELDGCMHSTLVFFISMLFVPLKGLYISLIYNWFLNDFFQFGEMTYFTGTGLVIMAVMIRRRKKSKPNLKRTVGGVVASSFFFLIAYVIYLILT